MNAPFQARAGLRDPFTAFVCDDATADMLRPVAVEHGWSPEKVHKGGLRNAVQTLSVSASPNILFVDLSESADPLNDINALAEVCEPGTIVIAAGQVNDVRLYRDLVASGIHDYLLKPFTVDQLRDSFAHAQMILSGPRGEAQADKPHVMSAVIGVRGRGMDHVGGWNRLKDTRIVAICDADKNVAGSAMKEVAERSAARCTRHAPSSGNVRWNAGSDDGKGDGAGTPPRLRGRHWLSQASMRSRVIQHWKAGSLGATKGQGSERDERPEAETLTAPGTVTDAGSTGPVGPAINAGENRAPR